MDLRSAEQNQAGVGGWKGAWEDGGGSGVRGMGGKGELPGAWESQGGAQMLVRSQPLHVMSPESLTVTSGHRHFFRHLSGFNRSRGYPSTLLEFLKKRSLNLTS